MSLGLLKREFHSLQDRCRATILGHLSHKEQIDELKLPQRIKLFIYEGLDNFQDHVWPTTSHSPIDIIIILAQCFFLEKKFFILCTILFKK